jgi:putative PIN family toxin of toxin-antitoxin system
MRVILDTNIWVSALISKDFEWIDGLFVSENIELVFSERLLTEFLHVARRPKLRKFISEERLTRIIELLDTYATMVTTTSSIDLCRDPDDNFLLELAVDAPADLLVTGDNDLLSLKAIGNCRIVTIVELRDMVNKL